MVNFVIKKDETKEPFDAEKIKHGVNTAAAQAGLGSEQAQALADKVLAIVQDSMASMGEVKALDIREKILSFLDAQAPKVAEAWRNYEATK